MADFSNFQSLAESPLFSSIRLNSSHVRFAALIILVVCYGELCKLTIVQVFSILALFCDGNHAALYDLLYQQSNKEGF